MRDHYDDEVRYEDEYVPAGRGAPLHPADVVAYLIVLDYGPVLDRIAPWIGMTVIEARYGIIGCLRRIYEALDYTQDTDERGLLELIRYRERLNGFMDKNHPQLQSATRSLAKVLCLWLEEQYGKQRQHWD